GDTGYSPHFKAIRERHGAVDLALLPIGAYEPRWFMRDQHMDPDDAIRAHLDLQARLSVGTHFGCFQLTDDRRPRHRARSTAAAPQRRGGILPGVGDRRNARFR